MNRTKRILTSLGLAVAVILPGHDAIAGQPPVALASAATFAVLAGSTVTNTGATTVSGNLGVSAGTSVTGFSSVDGGPGTVNGTIYKLTPGLAATAQGDLTIAYNDAAGRTVGAVLVAGNLGGQTLTPGLYKSTSSLEISSGDLTLDAQGNGNAVFIFQMASTLTTTSGRQVILSGGAKAINVFWQVGSSATLGTTTVFKGTILADQSITLTTGARLEGRALARLGAVTLDANTVTAPPIAPPINLGASCAISPSAVVLDWIDDSPNETGFKIQRKLSPRGRWSPVARVEADVDTFVNSDLSIGLTYFYRVLAVNPAGRSKPSNVASATLVSTITPPAAAPSGLSATTVSSMQINLRWTDTTNNECGFRIQRALSSVGPWQIVATRGASITSYADKKLASNTTYFYRVTDYNPNGSSIASNVASATTLVDTTAPTVSSTVPANAATGVSISGKIAAAFSEAMAPLTLLGGGSFALKQGTTPVAGTVSYTGVTATFTPAGNLAPLTTYTATIIGAEDLAGNALATDVSWSFTTGVTPDTTAPTVSFTVPTEGATNVAINQTVNAVFSEAMDPSTISIASFTLKQGITPVVGTVRYAGVTATFTRLIKLAPLTSYTATITGARDLAGNELVAEISWSFTTGAAPDTIAPTVSVTVPADAATGVAINQTINATFSEAMDPLTINTATLILTGPGATPVTGTVRYDVPSKIATLNPASDLAPNTVYTATITTGATDLARKALAAGFNWSFTTAATPAGQAPVALGAATPFAILAGSTVTNAGATTVSGNLGVSTGTSVTGFSSVDGGPGIVNGTIYNLTPGPAAIAQGDLTIAYDDAAGRTVGAVLVAGNLGGQTLTPGLYTSTSSLEISSGDLTLDAQGDINAVFIFQMASTLTTTVGRQVILSGGAKAANVFWQVGSSATLGTGSVFKGNILALASITVTTGARLEGRALARTAAVTLDSNTVTIPVP